MKHLNFGEVCSFVSFQLNHQERENARLNPEWMEKYRKRAKIRDSEWDDKDSVVNRSKQVLQLDVHAVKHNLQTVTHYIEPPSRSEARHFVSNFL